MTQKEMTEIFSIMLLAFPNAETFKGGVAKLGPTINLWCACLPDVDFWTGKQAVLKLCRECRFPPTIAEFREKAADVAAEQEAQIEGAWSDLKIKMKLLGLSPEEAVAHELTPEIVRMAVAHMGGPEALIQRLPDGSRVYAYQEFRAAYDVVARRDALSGAGAIGSRSARQIEGRQK